MTNTPLWQRIHQFDPDKLGVSFPFSRRLAREMGWNRRFTIRAIEEYRRFAYLACTAGHPVTPSEQVDAVWHLHLIYTRSYWDDFCGQVLQQPLHHNPTEGGDDENTKFTDWYNKTLQTYHSVFGHPAPTDIWPPTAVRFERKQWQWIDLSSVWVFKKWW